MTKQSSYCLGCCVCVCVCVCVCGGARVSDNEVCAYRQLGVGGMFVCVADIKL